LCHNKDMGHRRPDITQLHIEQIRQLIEGHPDWHRTRLSEELCELWGWKSDIGQLKSISCRDLLRALDARGQIKLPPQKKSSRKKGGAKDTGRQLSFLYTAPIEKGLKDVAPLIVEIADAKDKISEFKTLIEQQHYLSYGQSVGECIRYIVRSRDGVTLACLMYGSSAWRCAPRDRFIGWSDAVRTEHLHLTTNNTRFLILEGVRVPYLASHVLSLISRRISQDWQTKYGHPLHLIETFVERNRFAGTCYKAANWIHVGETTGRGRDSVSAHAILPIKDVYILPLTTDFRKRLAAPNLSKSGKGGSQ